MFKKLRTRFIEQLVLWSKPLPKESVLRHAFPHQVDCPCDRHLDTPVTEYVGLHWLDNQWATFCNLEPKITQHILYTSSWIDPGRVVTRYYLQCRHCQQTAEYQSE